MGKLKWKLWEKLSADSDTNKILSLSVHLNAKPILPLQGHQSELRQDAGRVNTAQSDLQSTNACFVNQSLQVWSNEGGWGVFKSDL